MITIFAIALNHRQQLDYWSTKFNQDPYKSPPKFPVWFIKPRNTYARTNDEVPFTTGMLSGATIALIISKQARRIKASNADSYIKSCALANEISLIEDDFYRPAIKAKCLDKSCVIGESTELKDICKLEIKTSVNGELKNSWNTGDLIRPASLLLEALSEFTTLESGDMILIGTPLERVNLQPNDKVLIQAAGLIDLEHSIGGAA